MLFLLENKIFIFHDLLTCTEMIVQLIIMNYYLCGGRVESGLVNDLN